MEIPISKQERNDEWFFFPCLYKATLTQCYSLQAFPRVGFSITIIHTNFNSPSSSNYPHFDFHSIPDGLLETQASTTDAIAFLTLLNVRLPFLWVVRPGLVHEAAATDDNQWLECLPKSVLEMLDGGSSKGHIVKWAPQQEVLAHASVGAFWTHNGWNSILESICEGVPMICQPCSGDQWVNARYVCDVWRIGLHLERKLERGEIERAIRRVILEVEGQRES
ncbi:hypothetical protein JRO89_XS14G0079100 [Xanthoceras sorbifolium]|uniref:Uncharacterized protein n=1 Tax=Xanthoceras sorbifolium TaxID=99658 RepID=A0ABQ8H4F0_9ROSI|nr:hypothetical protein JRO89_XS14G0079100 [Xanthoceras sorbifolium]